MDFMNKFRQSKELKWLKIAKSAPFPSNKHVSSDIDHGYIQGGYFHCCCDWLLDSFLFGSKIKGRSEKKHACIRVKYQDHGYKHDAYIMDTFVFQLEVVWYSMVLFCIENVDVIFK